MKLGSQVRRMALVTAGIAVVALAALLGGSLGTRDTSADVVSGQYSMEVIISETSVPVGNTFTAQLWIQHNFAISDCASDPSQTGCYAAAQWNLDFDQTVVSAGANCMGAAACTTITRQAGSPTQCNQEANNGDRVLTGCIDISGDVLEYSGHVFNIVFTCTSNGPAVFTLTTGTQPTFVATFDGTNQPIHVHGDTVSCGTGATATPTRTNTPAPATATFTPTRTPTRTATPCPTTGCTTPTVHPRHTNTPTPAATDTPGAGETPPPGGETPPPTGGTPGTTPPTGGGGAGGGGVTPPDTGSGGNADAGSATWLVLGLTAAGALAAGGGYAVRRAAQRR